MNCLQSVDRKCLSKGLLNYNICLNINYVMDIVIKNIWRQSKTINLIIIIDKMFNLILKRGLRTT